MAQHAPICNPPSGRQRRFPQLDPACPIHEGKIQTHVRGKARRLKRGIFLCRRKDAPDLTGLQSLRGGFERARLLDLDKDQAVAIGKDQIDFAGLAPPAPFKNPAPARDIGRFDLFLGHPAGMIGAAAFQASLPSASAA